jgi:cation transport protein ChaC
MKTNLGRGSFKKPGLMLGLDKGGSCRGSAFKLRNSEAIKNIDILFRREMVTGAYKPKLLKTILVNGRKVLSLAFTVDKKHKNYFQDKEIQTKAKMISNAHGFLGTCEEYFQNTLESLSELNIVDSEMTAISNYLKKN